MRSFIKRRLTAKGHGVHSPFAFSFINKVIYEKLPYYAYTDIEIFLKNNGVSHERINAFNKLSFRLVNFFLPSNILEIGSGIGVNTLFLTSTSKNIKCHCIENDPTKMAVAQDLFRTRNVNIHFVDEIPLMKFDAIVIDLNSINSKELTNINKLIDVSQDKAFWIINNIHNNKLYNNIWEDIKTNPRIQNTFELKHYSIVILNSSLSKLNYIL